MLNPASFKSTFRSHLIAHNRPHLDDFQKWLFLPGMLFNSREKWWGTNGARPAPHEGIDLCSFEDSHGKSQNLDRHTRIPAVFAGEIVKIERDFLGQSIYIRHQIFDDRERQLYSAYGHTRPLDALHPGTQVAEGEVIATISDLFRTQPDILVHVHITFAWVPVALEAGDLNWENLGKNSYITLIDPLGVLEGDSP